jgi:hypothetical protein
MEEPSVKKTTLLVDPRAKAERQTAPIVGVTKARING